jgi:hypothetical protein
VRAFDAYEVHGVAEFGTGADRFCEQVPDAEAQFWSLYGHIPGRGLECIGDFKTRRHAEDVLARIVGRTRGVPRDPARIDDKRAEWAAVALDAFAAETGADEEDALGDLLADLMHWCDRHGYDFELALDRARGHYEAETERPQGPSVSDGGAK